MNISDLKNISLCEKLANYVEEQCFLFDIEFNCQYCEYLFLALSDMFSQKGKTELFESEIKEYITYCIRDSISKDYNDYYLFLNNLSMLKNFSKKDLEKVKENINISITNEIITMQKMKTKDFANVS